MFPIRSHQANGSTFLSLVFVIKCCVPVEHIPSVPGKIEASSKPSIRSRFLITHERGTRTKPNAKPVQTNLPYLFFTICARRRSHSAFTRSVNIWLVSRFPSPLRLCQPQHTDLSANAAMHYANARTTIRRGARTHWVRFNFIFHLGTPAGVQNHNTHSGGGGGCGCCRIHYARAPCAPPPHRDGSFHLSRPSRFMMRALLILDDSWAWAGQIEAHTPHPISATRQNKTQIAKYFMSLDTQAPELCLISFHIKAYCARAQDVSRVCTTLVVVVRLFAAAAQFFLGLLHESYSIFYADNSVGQRAGCWFRVSTNKKWRVLYIQVARGEILFTLWF